MSVHFHVAVPRSLSRSVFAFALLVAASSPALPTEQSADTAQLTARIAADQAQIRRLQFELAQAQNALEQGQGDDSGDIGDIQVAGLFGESDEEKAERLREQQHEQNQDASINTLSQRVGDLEETLRRLTGQMEQLQHSVKDFNDRITHMQKDFDYKLCTLVSQQLGATNPTSDQSTLPCEGQQGAAPDSGTTPAGAPPQRLANPPGILGTLPQSAVANNAPQASIQPQTDTRGQFDAAMNLLAKAQYDEARAAFRAFVDTYPKDDLAPQAMYWVGDIAYVQKNYADAQHDFAESLRRFPTSPRAPESMLKLGESLLATNQKKEGCLALGTLQSRYPTASKAVLAQAHDARHSAGCR